MAGVWPSLAAPQALAMLFLPVVSEGVLRVSGWVLLWRNQTRVACGFKSSSGPPNDLFPSVMTPPGCHRGVEPLVRLHAAALPSGPLCSRPGRSPSTIQRTHHSASRRTGLVRALQTSHSRRTGPGWPAEALLLGRGGRKLETVFRRAVALSREPAGLQVREPSRP